MITLVASKMSTAAWFYNQKAPLLFSTGSGQFPQSSILSMTDAYLNGADFIDVTVQMTSDRILVVNNQACIKNTTTAQASFPKRALRTVNLQRYNCTADYMIAGLNISMLRRPTRVQAFENRNQDADFIYKVMSLNETINQLRTFRDLYPSNKKVGLTIQIDEAAWYKEVPRSLDILEGIKQVLAS